MRHIRPFNEYALACFAMYGAIALAPTATHAQSNDAGMLVTFETVKGDLRAAVERAPSDTEGRRELKALLTGAMPGELSTEQAERLVTTLADVGSLSDDGKHDTGFLQYESVARALAVTMRSERAETRDLSALMLLHHGSSALLARCADEIRAGLAGVSYGEAVRLEAMLPLEDARKREILAGRDVPIEVRGRLGEQEAVKAIIAEFRASDEFQTKAESAALLGYIGTAACAEALLSEFNSPVVSTHKYDRISIRWAIIEALGRMHPDEPLLTSEIRDIARQGDDSYGRKNVDAYLDRVAVWARENLEIAVRPEPQDVLWKKIVYKFPADEEHEEKIVEVSGLGPDAE